MDTAVQVPAPRSAVARPAGHATVLRDVLGADAAPGAGAVADGHVARLSMRALRYGQTLAITDAPVLSLRLYAFGTIARGPRWDRQLGAGDEVAGALGLGQGGGVRRVLEAGYDVVTHPHWIAWTRADERCDTRPTLAYKLYISPRPEVVADCFRIAAGVLADTGVWSFKLGRGVQGLLRPDKLVVYLHDFDELERVSGALARALAGYPAHGVPFTAAITEDGMLSWGMDPPPAEGLPSSRPQESWRFWITNRLAGALVHAQSTAVGVQPWEFALGRLEHAGIDTSSWRAVAPNWTCLDRS